MRGEIVCCGRLWINHIEVEVRATLLEPGRYNQVTRATGQQVASLRLGVDDLIQRKKFDCQSSEDQRFCEKNYRVYPWESGGPG
jgi:hypothetical protein